MKQNCAIAVLVCSFIVSPAGAGGDIDRLAELLKGKFDTHSINADVPAGQRLVDKGPAVPGLRINNGVIQS